MLPSTATPSARPSSAAVSEIADAAPARSGGADDTIKSVVSVIVTEIPAKMTAIAVATVAAPGATLSANIIAKPIMLTITPEQTTRATGQRRIRRGAIRQPIMLVIMP